MERRVVRCRVVKDVGGEEDGTKSRMNLCCLKNK